MKWKHFRYTLLIGCLLIGTLVTGCGDKHLFKRGTTVPTPVGDSFLVVGDNRSGGEIYENIIASITSSLTFASCLINTGDMIAIPGNRRQWEYFLNVTAPVAAIMPWYATIGNHDVNSLATQRIYQEVMDLPGNELYYSFDTINSHFIVLDTEIPGQVGGIVGEQLIWLKQDLQTFANSAEYVFVFTHRPVYPQGRYRGEDLANADELHQLFTEHGVDIIFSGHEHQYYIYPKGSLHYVVTGGGGAPIYEGGTGESFHHYLLVELLPPENILIHVLDIHGRAIQMDVVTTN